MMRRMLFTVALALLALGLQGRAATDKNRIQVPGTAGISWWVGIIDHGSQMPLEEGYAANVEGNNYGNQVQPLALSNEGDVIWSEGPFSVQHQAGSLLMESSCGRVVRSKSGTTLREAFLFASRTYFPPSGKAPDELLFSSPQYNTWIELMYNQNQTDILKYAQAIREHGFPPGVLMIDDNCQEDYGKWNFHPGRFSDPKSMVATLHTNGFKVMLWVCPFVSADSDVYRELAQKRLLLRDSGGEPAIVRW